MALAPYTVTALAESDADGTDGKNIVAGAVVSLLDDTMSAVLLYDDGTGLNPSTTKTTGANGQVVIYAEQGNYTLSNNGVESKVSVVSYSGPDSIAEWDDEQEYNNNSLAVFGRSVFQSQTDLNKGNNPSLDGVNWRLEFTYIKTTTELIASTEVFPAGTVIELDGFTTAGDGGGEKWKATGNTITESQTPAQTGGATCSDANGNEFTLIKKSEINVKMFGAKGDGVTDDTLAVQSALSSGIKHLYLPSGTYLITSPVSLDSVSVVGDGDASIIKSEPSGTQIGLNITGLKFRLKDFTIDMGGSTSPVALLMAGAETSEVILEGLNIIGTNSFSGGIYNANGIKVADGTSSKNITVQNCKFINLFFPIFTSNNYGASSETSENWAITSSLFLENEVGHSFNTDFATSGVTNVWRCVTLTGNVFDTVNTNAALGGMDGASDIAYVGNIFRNSNLATDPEAALHLENLGGNITVTGNIFENVYSGIFLYPLSSNFNVSGNSMVGKYNRTLSDDPSTFLDPGDGNRSFGVQLIFNTDGVADTSIISNNTISNFDIGISGGETRANSITNNIISLCYSGIIFTPNSYGTTYENNTIQKCNYGYQVGSSDGIRGFIGNNTLVDCANVIENLNDFVGMHGLTVVLTEVPDIINGATTYTALMPQPTRMDCKLNVNVQRVDNKVFNSMGNLELTKDNSSVFTSNTIYNISPFALSLAGYQENVGNLEFGIFNNSGADITCKYEVRFDGFIAWYS